MLLFTNFKIKITVKNLICLINRKLYVNVLRLLLKKSLNSSIIIRKNIDKDINRSKKMTHTYKTKGVCAKAITIEVDENDVIKKVEFLGGCPGNLLGMSTLSVGRTIDDIVSKCKGIRCGFRKTSCPDQLSIALEEIKNAKSA